METKAMDKIHRGCVKQYHTLCGLLGLTQDEKMAILSSYGVDSSVDIDTHDLIDLCAKLSSELEARNSGGDLDKLRKRAMAAIGGYLKATGKFSNSDIIKGIACRATGYENFNRIPKERLRNLYYTFNNKVKDMDAADILPMDMERMMTMTAGMSN